MGARFRVTTSAIVVAMVGGLAACSAGAAPSPTASLTPTATTTPSATATPTATATASASVTPTAGVFAGRNPSMSDAEALARIANPATGETWFPTPKAIAAPSWAKGDSYLGGPSIHWYELGTRGDHTIVCFVDDNAQEIFERAPDGTWQWIGAPSAREPSVGGTDVTFNSPSVPLNDVVYYDSMTLPAEFTLPTGEVLEVNPNDRGGLANPGYTVVNQPTGTTVDSLGGYSIIRYTVPVTFVWSEYYGVPDPPDVSYQDMYYMLHTPYGMYIPLYYRPVASLSDVAWTVPTSFTTDEYSYIADLNDIACGAWERDHNTIVTGIPASEWSVGGTTPLGANVYVPTPDNRLVQPLYAAYVASKDAAGQPHDSLAQFLSAPAFFGYQVPGSSTWLVYLNGTYSGRAWC